LWLWIIIDYEQQWLPAGAEMPTGPRKDINSPKAMLFPSWSPPGFPVIQAAAPTVTFTAKSPLDNILPIVVTTRPSCDRHWRIVLHLGNVHRTNQKVEENRIVTSPHQAFSLDFARSDFFLFAALVGQFNGLIFESAD
jgi:uncharacterized protein (DUF1786 family)